MTTIALDSRQSWVDAAEFERGAGLVPVRVTLEGETLYEGLGIELSRDVVYFRTPDWPRMHVGDRVGVDVYSPLDGWGERYWIPVRRTATVSRVESQALTSAAGCRPRRCPVVLVLEEEPVGV